MTDLPIGTRLLKSFLALRRDVLREHIALSRWKGVCWACGRRRKLDPVDGQCRRGHFSSLSRRPGREEWRTVNYLKGVAKMGWKQAREDAASRGGFISLKEDGETADIVPLTEPEPTEKDGFKKGEKRTVYRVSALRFPFKPSSNVANLDLSIFAFNAYAAQVGEGHEGRSVVRMTRHGAPNDVNTRYTFKVVRALSVKEKKVVKAIAKELADVPF